MVEIRNLANLASYRKLKRNEALCSQGDKAGSIFIVLSGLAGVIVNGKNVAYITRGQEIGELGLISNFALYRTATIVAHYDFEVAEIKYDDFYDFFEMLRPERAKRVADFVAECALPKYFSLSEWKREAIAEGNLAQRMQEKKHRSAQIQEMLDEATGTRASDRSSPLSLQSDASEKLGLSPYNRMGRLAQRKGKDCVDPSARHTEMAPTCDRQAMVEALVELGRRKDRKLKLAQKAVAVFQKKPEVGTEEFEKAAVFKFLGKFTNTCKAPTESSTPKPPVNSSRQPHAAVQDQDLSEIVYTVTDEHPSSMKAMNDERSHLPRVLNPEFSHRLEAFRDKIRRKNYVGVSRRTTSSPFSETRGLRFSPLVPPPVAECGQTTVRSDTRLSSAATKTSRTCTPLLPFTLLHPSSIAVTPRDGVQCKIDVRRALSSTFGNVAEAFVAVDRLGINSISHEELYAFLVELGVSANAVSEAMREIAGGVVVRLDSLEFMKLFAWHPLGTIQEQKEMVSEAQRRRFAIIASVARAVAAQKGLDKGQMSSFTTERTVFTAIRKNLGPIRGLFAASDGHSSRYTTDFVYERELTRQQFESGLRQVQGLGLSEGEIAHAFDVINGKQAQSITFAEIEGVLKDDVSRPLRTLVPRSSSGSRAIPLPPTGVPKPNGTTPRHHKYRPHSAKSERTSASVGAGQRPTTAKPRMYVPRQRPLSARAAGRVERLAIANPSPTSASQTPKVQSPESIAAWRDGQKLLLQARYDEAMTHFSTALALDSSNTGVMVSYAKALIDGYGDFDRAEDLYQRALAINPADASTWRLLGNFKRYARKNYAAADGHFKQALTIDPHDVDTLRDYADFKASQGDEDGAIGLHRRVLQEDSADLLAQSEVLRLRPIATAKQQMQQQQNENSVEQQQQDLTIELSTAVLDEVHQSIPPGGSLQKGTDASTEDGVCENVSASISLPKASEVETQQQNEQQSDMPIFALSALDVDMAGLGALLQEWGDVKTQKMALTASSAPLWIDKCLVKLDETLTLAESFHAASNKDHENVFRNAFANLLKLYYATQKRVQRGDVAPEQDKRQSSDRAHTSPDKQQRQLQSPRLDQGPGRELSDFLSWKAQEVEAKLQEDLRKGKSIDESVRLHFPSRSSAASQIQVRLHEIDLPDSVRAAIREHKLDGRPKNWRAEYATSPRSLRPWRG